MFSDPECSTITEPDMYGGEHRYASVPVDTVAQCDELCLHDNNCKMAAYRDVPSGMSCYLYDHYVEPVKARHSALITKICHRGNQCFIL